MIGVLNFGILVDSQRWQFCVLTVMHHAFQSAKIDPRTRHPELVIVFAIRVGQRCNPPKPEILQRSSFGKPLAGPILSRLFYSRQVVEVYRAMLPLTLRLSTLATPVLTIGLRKVQFCFTKRASSLEPVYWMRQTSLGVLSVGNVDGASSCVMTSFEKANASHQLGKIAKPRCMGIAFFALKKDVSKRLPAPELAFFATERLNNSEKIPCTESSVARYLLMSRNVSISSIERKKSA